MRLRHKTPLNPYKGQANNDKNEFNDDDFRQQGSPHKKTSHSNTDQIYKYAKLLAKFIKTVNQDYNAYAPHPHLPPDPLPATLEYQAIISDQHQQAINSLKRQQIKYQKQAPKLQAKKEPKEDSKVPKPTHKKKETGLAPVSARENKNKVSESSFQNAIDLSKNSIPPRQPPQNTNKNDQPQAKLFKNDPSALTPGNFPPRMQQNPGFNMQLPTNANSQSSQLNANNNLQGYLSMQGLLNSNQLGLDMYGGLGQMPMGQLGLRYNPLEGMMPGYMPMNMSMLMGLGLNNQILMQQQTMKPFQNLFSEQVKSFSQPPLQVSTPTGGRTLKETYPLKRSAFHVGIAYKIYLDKIKSEGGNLENMDEIDPTRHARRVKGGQAQARSRQSQKKKK